MAEKVNPGDDEPQSGPEGAGKTGKKSESKKTNGEAKKAKDKDSRQEAQSKREREAREKARKEREEQRAKGPARKIDFREARKAVKVIAAIQDEKKIFITPEELNKLKEILIDYGDFDPKMVGKMTPEEVVVEVQSVLRHAEITPPADSELADGESLSLIKAEIKQAQSADEETLTEEKVEDYLQVAGAGGEPPEEPPVTAEAAGGDEEEPQDIRDLIARMRDLVKEDRDKDTDPDWQRLSGQLQTQIAVFNQSYDQKGFRNVYDFAEAIEDAEYIAKNVPTGSVKSGDELLNRVVAEGTRREIITRRDRLDREFQEKYDSLNEKQRAMVFNDLEVAIGTELVGVKAGWRRLKDASAVVFGGWTRDEEGNLVRTRGAVGESRPKERSLGLNGILEWRATKELYGAQEQVMTDLLTKAPSRWQEIPQYLNNIYQFIESTDMSVDELQININKALGLLEAVRADIPEGRALRERLKNELEAFRAFHSMRITMERNDMNPKDLTPVFQNYFDDETWMKFAQRFATDSRDRLFVDKNGGDVNPFDLSFELYSARLRDDRILMNMVEEMTKYHIDHLPVSEIKKAVGFDNLPKEWKDRWEIELEKLRRYFIKKLDDKEISHDEWGKKKSEDMKKVIGDWHTKKTLQGAFGMVTKADLKDLQDEFGWSEKEAEEFIGRDFLAVRQKEILSKLEKKLKDEGLMVKREGESAKEANFDELTGSGFLESVNKNAYFTTWMFEWSNYDGIRVFNRETRSHLDDDFDDLVFHQNTNMFFGRHIDHIWEFYHDTNENRGRAKENDVNRIWKQHLPGKHHYIFPQNSIMVRWAENFMTQEQKDEVERRTFELMRENDFDNEKYHDEFYGWMHSVAVMDMIENGQFTFGQKVGEEKGEDFRFSKVAGKLRKFEMIDVFIDRNKHLEYVGPQAFQAYLANPTEDKFAEINDKEKVFYSTRAARQFPWMTLALRAHWEIANHHSMRLFDKPNLPSASMENVVKGLVGEGHVEKQQGDEFKRRYLTLLPFVEKNLSPSDRHAREFLGTVPFRRLRQASEIARRLAWESKFSPFVILITVLAAMGFEFAKRLPSQATGQTR